MHIHGDLFTLVTAVSLLAVTSVGGVPSGHLVGNGEQGWWKQSLSQSLVSGASSRFGFARLLLALVLWTYEIRASEAVPVS